MRSHKIQVVTPSERKEAPIQLDQMLVDGGDELVVSLLPRSATVLVTVRHRAVVRMSHSDCQRLAQALESAARQIDRWASPFDESAGGAR